MRLSFVVGDSRNSLMQNLTLSKVQPAMDRLRVLLELGTTFSTFCPEVQAELRSICEAAVEFAFEQDRHEALQIIVACKPSLIPAMAMKLFVFISIVISS